MLKVLLWIGAGFYFFEAIIHILGLPILEHDEIFLPTHDRYIALFAVTYAALLILISTNVQKYRQLFWLVMAGILLSLGNAALIARLGGYDKFFQAPELDKQLSIIGIFALIWYFGTWLAWFSVNRKT